MQTKIQPTAHLYTQNHLKNPTKIQANVQFVFSAYCRIILRYNILWIYESVRFVVSLILGWKIFVATNIINAFSPDYRNRLGKKKDSCLLLYISDSQTTTLFVADWRTLQYNKPRCRRKSRKVICISFRCLFVWYWVSLVLWLLILAKTWNWRNPYMCRAQVLLRLSMNWPHQAGREWANRADLAGWCLLLGRHCRSGIGNNSIVDRRLCGCIVFGCARCQHENEQNVDYV